MTAIAADYLADHAALPHEDRAAAGIAIGERPSVAERSAPSSEEGRLVARRTSQFLRDGEGSWRMEGRRHHPARRGVGRTIDLPRASPQSGLKDGLRFVYEYITAPLADERLT